MSRKPWTQYEYRINKKGAECFRTSRRDELVRKYLSFHGDPKYTMQVRSMRLGGYIGFNCISWSPWEPMCLSLEEQNRFGTETENGIRKAETNTGA